MYWVGNVTTEKFTLGNEICSMAIFDAQCVENRLQWFIIDDLNSSSDPPLRDVLDAAD
jgi:hypothetical protein